MAFRPLWKSLVSKARGGKGLVLAIDGALKAIWDAIDTIVGISGSSGSSTFNGSTGVTVDIGETLDDTNYRVVITATENSEDVGAIYVTDKTTTTFVVKCTGTGVVDFDWVLIYNN